MQAKIIVSHYQTENALRTHILHSPVVLSLETHKGYPASEEYNKTHSLPSQYYIICTELKNESS